MHSLDKAREWANRGENLIGIIHPDAKAAIEIIQSIPDQWVDAGRLRQIIDFQGSSISDEARKDLESLFIPKLPTLADMSQEEREACQWMQCEIDGQLAGILARVDEQRGHIWVDSGYSLGWKLENITPLPDLPKLQWPGGVVDCEIVDEPETTYSSSIHTPMQPSEVPANEPWLIEFDGQKAIGTRYQVYTDVPWSVAVLDGAFAGDYSDNEVTLIHKLVPETHALPEGMRLADHETLGRIVVSQRADEDGDYAFFQSIPGGIAGASWGYVNESEITFLDGGS